LHLRGRRQTARVVLHDGDARQRREREVLDDLPLRGDGREILGDDRREVGGAHRVQVGQQQHRGNGAGDTGHDDHPSQPDDESRVARAHSRSGVSGRSTPSRSSSAAAKRSTSPRWTSAHGVALSERNSSKSRVTSARWARYSANRPRSSGSRRARPTAFRSRARRSRHGTYTASVGTTGMITTTTPSRYASSPTSRRVAVAFSRALAAVARASLATLPMRSPTNGTPPSESSPPAVSSSACDDRSSVSLNWRRR